MSDVIHLIDAITKGDLQQVISILDNNYNLVNQRDDSGATPLHYATVNGHQQIVRLLVERGAEINAPDSKFGATPTGWAIEYLRELNGHLAIELGDLAHAIKMKDVHWVARFLNRFPALRHAKDTKGIPFRQLARESGNQEIATLFGLEDGR